MTEVASHQPPPHQPSSLEELSSVFSWRNELLPLGAAISTFVLVSGVLMFRNGPKTLYYGVLTGVTVWAVVFGLRHWRRNSLEAVLPRVVIQTVGWGLLPFTAGLFAFAAFCVFRSSKQMLPTFGKAALLGAGVGCVALVIQHLDRNSTEAANTESLRQDHPGHGCYFPSNRLLPLATAALSFTLLSVLPSCRRVCSSISSRVAGCVLIGSLTFVVQRRFPKPSEQSSGRIIR